mmetsp:Transcript_1863/g.4779  ORF Transcript_1863/g.4779 Transcript_1863/m.4779 type:complete len:210 (-) Transcript_1863:252-881(-)
MNAKSASKKDTRFSSVTSFPAIKISKISKPAGEASRWCAPTLRRALKVFQHASVWMRSGLAFTRCRSSENSWAARMSATLASSLRMSCSDRSRSSAMSSLYGTSRWQILSKPNTPFSTNGLKRVAESMIDLRCSKVLAHVNSILSLFLMVVLMSRSRQRSALSSSSSLFAIPFGVSPADQIRADTKYSNDSASRNLLSVKISSMWQDSM